MSFSKSLKCAATLLLMASASGVPTAALASPGGGVTAETYVTGKLKGAIQQNSDKVKFQTKDDTAVRVQKLTFSPGGFTGWHHHPGIVIVTVQSGTIQMMHSDCSTHEYGQGMPHGSVFIEGEQRVHEASSADGAVVFATYVAPNADAPVFRVANAERKRADENVAQELRVNSPEGERVVVDAGNRTI